MGGAFADLFGREMHRWMHRRELVSFGLGADRRASDGDGRVDLTVAIAKVVPRYERVLDD